MIGSIDGLEPKEFFNNFVDNILKTRKENKMETKRSEVYGIIENEVNFIDECCDKNPTMYDVGDGEKTISDWLNYIGYHLEIARVNTRRKTNIYNVNNQDTLNQIRKIAALAVKCLELYGCPERIAKTSNCDDNCKCKKD